MNKVRYHALSNFPDGIRFLYWYIDIFVYWYIVGVIKLRRMRWAGHVAHMGEERGGV